MSQKLSHNNSILQHYFSRNSLFPGVPTQVGKLWKFQGLVGPGRGGGGSYKYSLEWKFQKGGASKAKVFSVSGMDILGNYTI